MGSGAVAAGKENFNGIRTPKNPKWHLSMHHQLQQLQRKTQDQIDFDGTCGKRKQEASRGNAKRASPHLCAAQARKSRERVQGGYVVIRLHSSVAVGYRKDGKTHDLQLLLEYGDEEDSALF